MTTNFDYVTTFKHRILQELYNWADYNFFQIPKSRTCFANKKKRHKHFLRVHIRKVLDNKKRKVCPQQRWCDADRFHQYITTAVDGAKMWLNVYEFVQEMSYDWCRKP